MTYKPCDLEQVTTSSCLSFLVHTLWLVTAPASQGYGESEMRSYMGWAQFGKCQHTVDIQ